MARESAGYSGTPLASKLGLRPGIRVVTVGAPANYRMLLGDLARQVTFGKQASPLTDVVHGFFTRRVALTAALGSYRTRLRADAVVWVSWPKRASGVATDVTEDVIREVALPLGFVDVKVCAVDEVWSGLKLVVRKELR